MLQETFGLPPDNLMAETNRKILDSMPVCHFIPSQPVFKFGLDLFFLRQAFNQTNNTDPSYRELLQTHGFDTPNTPGQGIKVAYLADNFPTDTFTNEYGENFLQSMTDVASQGAAQISQFFGVKNAAIAGQRIAKTAGGVLPDKINIMGQDFDVKGAGKKFFEMAKTMTENLVGQAGMQAGANATNVVGRLLAGARLDFPMVWKSSGFQPSYSLTVRLYNPNPRSLKSTKRFIVGPIVALMLLGVPISQDGSTFSWPYLHKIVSPGIFELNPGFIQNITVIKGGDQQQISQQQHLSIVDVRIDIGSLYSSMIAGTSVNEKTRPTVRKYMNSMLQSGTAAPKRHTVYDRKGQKLGYEAYANQKKIDRISRATGRANVWSRREADYRKPSPDQSPTKEESTDPQPRVSTRRQNLSGYLTENTDPNYGNPEE